MIIEIFAVVFSFLCVYLSTIKNPLAWVIGIVGIFFYMFVFYENNLYADFILQFVFISQSIYGWVNWIKNKSIKTDEVKVEYLTNKNRIKYIFFIICTYAIVAFTLNKYTNSSVPYIDSFVATLSLYANWLLAQRKIENWIIWMVANVIYVGLFIYKGLYLSSGLYFIFLINSIRGLILWSKFSLISYIVDYVVDPPIRRTN